MAKRVKKVILLVHPRFRPDRVRTGGQTETDVWSALKKLGFTVEVATADRDLRALDQTLAAARPQVVFNLLEEFRGEAVFDFHLVSYLEALGIPFTGCNPRGLIQSRNKLICGQIAAALGVSVPRGYIWETGSRVTNPQLASLKFPLFVKLNREHASLGIRESSMVRDVPALRVECSRMRRAFAGEVLVQEFVAGQDVSVALWGNGSVQVFEPRWLSMGGSERVSTERMKFSPALQRRRGVRSRVYIGPAAEQIRREAVRIYSVLELSGYARFDYRVNANHIPYLIDLNANPNLARSEDFALSARQGGIEYPEALKKIIALGLNYQPNV